MPNSYNSNFTGEHNDEYDSRITALEPIVTSLNNTIIPNMQTAFNNLASNVLACRSANPTTTSTDTKDTWVNLEAGFYWYGLTGGVNGQPSQWGWLLHIHDVGSAEIYQIWLDMGSKTKLYVRGANASTTAMPNFTNPCREASLIQGSSYSTVSWTTAISTAASSWKDVLVNWTAPSNGWLCCYFNNGSNTPAAAITDNTNGFQVRQNGNGSRDVTLTSPVTAGHSYTVNCIYLKTNYARFFPAV